MIGAMHPVTTLFILAIPIACVVRTVVYEELFREFRDGCAARSQACRKLVQRKFFYLFTCEYCFSHYVTALFLVITGFRTIGVGIWSAFFRSCLWPMSTCRFMPD